MTDNYQKLTAASYLCASPCQIQELVPEAATIAGAVSPGSRWLQVSGIRERQSGVSICQSRFGQSLGSNASSFLPFHHFLPHFSSSIVSRSSSSSATQRRNFVIR